MILYISVLTFQILCADEVIANVAEAIKIQGISYAENLLFSLCPKICFMGLFAN